MFVSDVFLAFHILHCYIILDLDRLLTHVILVGRITSGQGEYMGTGRVHHVHGDMESILGELSEEKRVCYLILVLS